MARIAKAIPAPTRMVLTNFRLRCSGILPDRVRVSGARRTCGKFHQKLAGVVGLELLIAELGENLTCWRRSAGQCALPSVPRLAAFAGHAAQVPPS